MRRGQAWPSGSIGRSHSRQMGRLLAVRSAIIPDDGQTMRGLKASMSRAAKRKGTKITSWDVDGTLYIKLAI